MIRITLCFIMLAGCRADVAKAKREAEEFAKNVDGATSVHCNDSDSDNDGYVSCTIFRGKEDPLAISCGAERFCSCNCASGCKMTQAVLKQSAK